MSIRIHSYSLLCLLFFVKPFGALADVRDAGDPLITLVNNAVASVPPASSGVYVEPSVRQLDDWREAIKLYRAGRLDSCRTVLAGLNYSLTAVRDPISGSTFEVFAERVPLRNGWGTLIHNPRASKAVNIHVNHTVDDPNIPRVGAELFRRAGARWMLIGGSARHAVPGSSASDMALAPGSVFQRWHETVSDPSQVSISLHTYNPGGYPFPISAAEVVVSNGRTTDLQWGISQISLNLRDSLRSAGFHTALAMLDSGFARLAGGSNAQGTWSNNHYGFGRWLNIELASGVRNQPALYRKFIDVTDRILSVTGTTVAGNAPEAFGLVSPRVVKIDRANKLLFPPPQPEKYRVISFSAGKSARDTLDLLFGNWIDTRDGGIARIVEYDTTGSIAGRSTGPTVTKLVAPPPGKFVSGIRPVEHRPADTLAGDEGEEVREPIQVHRIPLEPVLAATVSPEVESAVTPFHWGGILPAGFTPQVFAFRSAAQAGRSGVEVPGLSRFLIPLLRSSYRTGGDGFVGVDMTDLLVNEIARLVSEYRVEGREIGLMAEQGEDGDYYLRLFPGHEPGPVHTSTNLP